MDDEIEFQIKLILPSIEDKQLKDLVNCLIDLGISKISDLNLVEEDDLKGAVKTIQARLLVKNWKNIGKLTFFFIF